MAQFEVEEFVRPLSHAFYLGGLILVTESVEGTRFDSEIDDIDPIIAECWANDLSSALGKLHATGRIHGRLSPYSIYKTSQGPRIVGAGVSDLWEPVWAVMDIEGSMAPRKFVSLEVRLNGTELANATADIYSLGAILYRGYTQRCVGEYCPLPSRKADVETHIDQAVMLAVHSDPLSRQQTMREFLEELSGVRRRVAEVEEPELVFADRIVVPVKRHWLEGKGEWVGEAAVWAAVAFVLVALGWWGIDSIDRGGELKEQPLQLSSISVEPQAMVDEVLVSEPDGSRDPGLTLVEFYRLSMRFAGDIYEGLANYPRARSAAIASRNITGD